MNKFLEGYKTYDPDRDGYGSSFDWKKNFFHRMNKDDARLYLNEDDPYIILGISRNATKQEVKKAYRKQAMLWHPDKHPGNEKQAEERFKKINAAYSILT